MRALPNHLSHPTPAKGAARARYEPRNLLTRGICLSGLILSLIGCRCMAPSTLDASAANTVRRDVREMASSIARDIAADGPNAWLRYFADSPEFFMANNGNMQFSNYGDAVTFLGNFSKGVAHLELTWVEPRVDPLTSGLAVIASPYREVLTDTEGHVRQFDGFFTGLAVKTKGGWELRDAHWSSPASSH